jgi:hypothetical protein
VPTYEPTQYRKALRRPRERGCSVYVPGEVLEQAGFGPDEPPPLYRMWAGRKGSRGMVQFYREESP